MQTKRARVLLLPFGPIARRKRIGPSEAIPIVDVLLDCNHFNVVDVTFIIQLLQEGIRGRATGATFRCEQFQNDWTSLREVAVGRAQRERRGSTERGSQQLSKR